MTENPLLRERDAAFILYDVLDVLALTKLDAFKDHGRDTIDPFLANVRRVSRDVLFPSYREIDQSPPRFENGSVKVHPKMRALVKEIIGLGVCSATRPVEVGGLRLPLTVSVFATIYLSAGNLSAPGFVWLSTGAAHLLETYGDEKLREQYMKPLYEGRFTGTMALTEPHAGSSLADVATRATPQPDGSYRISGSKIFISGGDHDLTDNIVHMVLARIDGAPAGIKGVSLFCVPKRRAEGNALKDNDVTVSGMIHKIGWRGLPSLALSFGDRNDCHGFLVGEPHRGISYMFQMMNEARIQIGACGVASASVAYHESLAYAASRPQGRHFTEKNAGSKQVPIVEHADVRRMLLRQKAIVEGSLALVARTAMYADLVSATDNEAVKAHSKLMLDLLTPVTKSFPAERGFESNALALQIHGGYGYTSEYLPEAWLRDQKLNTIHEGTTGIQGMDLLGRKVIAGGGAALAALRTEIEKTFARAKERGVDASLISETERALAEIESLTMHLGQKGMSGDVAGMMLHSTDYLDLFGTLVVAWQHLDMAAAASKRTAANDEEAAFFRGKVIAAEYWIRTELPRFHALASVVRAGEDSYARVTFAEL